MRGLPTTSTTQARHNRIRMRMWTVSERRRRRTRHGWTTKRSGTGAVGAIVRVGKGADGTNPCSGKAQMNTFVRAPLCNASAEKERRSPMVREEVLQDSPSSECHEFSTALLVTMKGSSIVIDLKIDFGNARYGTRHASRGGIEEMPNWKSKCHVNNSQHGCRCC